MDNLDWTLIPSFIAVADHGSLSAAARASKISQPTLGRHIRALEETAECELFHRHARGFELTEAGIALLPAARAMVDAAGRLSLIASGQTETLSGTVRLTASIFVSHYLLPPVIAEIRNREPDIQIELVANDGSDNLLHREADIAIRMYRPTQLDIVTRKLGDLQMGLFAEKSYLEKHGVPRTLADFADHDIVGYDQDTRIIEGMQAYGIKATREMFATRCDAQTVYWELVRAGCGIGAGQLNVGLSDPNLVQVLPESPIDPLPVWIAAPEAIHKSNRIRRIWDLLAEGITPLIS